MNKKNSAQKWHKESFKLLEAKSTLLLTAVCNFK